MSQSLIQIAASKGRTKWLQQLLLNHLPRLLEPSISYNAWFDELINKMEARGLVNPTQQKDYLTDVRGAIKVLDPSHPALKIVGFSKETWTEINNRNSDKLAQRTTKLLLNPDAIVQRATVLLGSHQWSEIAAGLAVVTGRRVTEVVQTATFKSKTKYSVIFTGALKRQNEPVECIFEIPTLCEAELVIKAIAQLRSRLQKKTAGLSPRQVQARFGRAVAKTCARYFSELVPPRDDKDNLYTHLFRAVYATIAAYWFCPPTVPQIEFRAAIQGHYQILDEQNPKLRRSIAAGRNYFDYQISDGQGNLDGRLGIKLHLPNVEVISEFQSAYIPPTPINTIMNDQHTTTIPAFLLPRLEAMSTRWGLSTSEMIKILFDCGEVVEYLADSLGVDKLHPHTLYDQVEQLKQTSSLPNSPSNTEPDSKDLVIADLSTTIKLLTQSLSEQKPYLNRVPTPNSTIQNAEPKSVSLSLETEQSSPTLEMKNGHNSHNTSHSQRPAKTSRNLKIQQSKQIVNNAIDAIMAFNNDPDRAESDKWYISISSVKKLSGIAQRTVTRVLQSRQPEIDQHHATHDLEPDHNIRGAKHPSIDNVIPF